MRRELSLTPLLLLVLVVADSPVAGVTAGRDGSVVGLVLVETHGDEGHGDTEL